MSPPAETTASANHSPSPGAARPALKRDELSETETASNGPLTRIPAASPRKPSGRPISSTTLPLTCTSSTASTAIPARTRASGAPRPTRATVFPATPAEVAFVSRIPTGASWLPSAAAATSKISLLSTAMRSAAPLPSITIPSPTSATMFSLTMNVRTGVSSAIPWPVRSWTRLPVMRTCPGAAAKRAGGDDDPVRARAVAELVDRVRVDGCVGPDDDAVAARGDLVADDVQRGAWCRRAGCDDAASVAREHVVPGDAARVEVGRAAAEVDAALEPGDDVVLDAEAGGEHADVVPRTGVDAPRADEDVAAERDDQAEPGELDRGTAGLARRVREDDEVLEVAQPHTSEVDRGRCRGAADDRHVLDRHGDRLLDGERRPARDEDRRGALPADAERARAADRDAVAEVVDAGGEADRAAGRLHLVDGVLEGERPSPA